MKKALSLLLVLVMVLSLCSVTAFAAENYTGKTVILYTANVRGDVDVYAKVAAAKTSDSRSSTVQVSNLHLQFANRILISCKRESGLAGRT